MIRDPWCAYHGSLCNLIRKLIETDNGEALVSLTRVHKVCDAEFALLLVQGTSDLYFYNFLQFIIKTALREDCERKYEGRMRSVLLLVRHINDTTLSKSNSCVLDRTPSRERKDVRFVCSSGRLSLLLCE